MIEKRENKLISSTQSSLDGLKKQIFDGETEFKRNFDALESETNEALRGEIEASQLYMDQFEADNAAMEDDIHRGYKAMTSGLASTLSSLMTSTANHQDIIDSANAIADATSTEIPIYTDASIKEAGDDVAAMVNLREAIESDIHSAVSSLDIALDTSANSMRKVAGDELEESNRGLEN